MILPIRHAQVLGLFRDRYYDLNMRHFHEKLSEEHGIELSYTWVQKALQGAGWYRNEASAGRIAEDGRGGR